MADTFAKEFVVAVDAKHDDPKATVAQLKALLHTRGVLVPDTTKPGEHLATKSSSEVRSLLAAWISVDVCIFSAAAHASFH